MCHSFWGAILAWDPKRLTAEISKHKPDAIQHLLGTPDLSGEHFLASRCRLSHQGTYFGTYADALRTLDQEFVDMYVGLGARIDGGLPTRGMEYHRAFITGETTWPVKPYHHEAQIAAGREPNLVALTVIEQTVIGARQLAAFAELFDMILIGSLPVARRGTVFDTKASRQLWVEIRQKAETMTGLQLPPLPGLNFANQMLQPNFHHEYVAQAACACGADTGPQGKKRYPVKAGDPTAGYECWTCHYDKAWTTDMPPFMLDGHAEQALPWVLAYKKHVHAQAI